MTRRRGRLLEVTQLFFDRAAVAGAVVRAEHRVMNHAGALTRKIARQSLRRRKRASAPGQPPTSRTGLLKNFTFYHYDRSRATVIVGPYKFGTRVPYVVTETLEFGGRVSRRGRDGRRIEMRYAARPYMRPALDKVAPRFPGLWRDTVR